MATLAYHVMTKMKHSHDIALAPRFTRTAPATLRRPNPRGFTLVELLVTIVIIVVLGGIAFVAYRSAMKRADTAQTLAKMKSVGASVVALSTENNGRVPQIYWTPGDSLPSEAYSKPNWLEQSAPGTVGKDWSIHAMWVWAVHNLGEVPLDAFTTSRANKAVKAQGEVQTWPAFCLNQNPQLSESEPTAGGRMSYWTQLSRYTEPSRVILLSEAAFTNEMAGLRPWSYGNYWGTMGFRYAVQHKKDGIAETPFIFIDGHAEVLSPEETIDRNRTRWMDPSMFPNKEFATERGFANYLRKFLK